MKKVLFVGMALLSLSMLRAQQNEVRFTVEVNTDSLLMGNLLQVRFILENGQGQDFQAPYFKGFSVVSGPNYASSMSTINGRTTQRLSYTFQLMPEDIGNYYIEPASIKVGGQYLETAPMEVVVAPNPDGIQQGPAPGQQPMLQFSMPGFEDLERRGFDGFNFPGFENFDMEDFSMPGFGDSFFNLDSLMREFHQLQPYELPEGDPEGQPGKKRKTYKL
ncbi:MAG: BatD family protein [Phaeodactylibacter sp.]|uniref:BatD family protein n=1 Tax=Phaeodactylibacter sp. TaxID=1940289 RepID=UPI0032EE701E